MLRLPGECQRKAVVRRVDHILRRVEERQRLVVLSLSDAHENELQHDLRLVRQQGQRIAIGGFGRGEAATGEISVAEQAAKTRIVRAAGHGALGEVDRDRRLLGEQRCLGTGGEANVARVGLAGEILGAPEIRCAAAAGAGAGRERGGKKNGAHRGAEA